MKIKVVSIRLQSLVSISDKAFKAEDFNGNIEILPKSQVFGQDFEVQKSNAYWVSEWILNQKNLTYSDKKTAWVDKDYFDSDVSMNELIPKDKTIIKTHKPKKITVNEVRSDTSSLLR